MKDVGASRHFLWIQEDDRNEIKDAISVNKKNINANFRNTRVSSNDSQTQVRIENMYC